MTEGSSKIVIYNYTTDPVIITVLLQFLKFWGQDYTIETRESVDPTEDPGENSFLVFDFQGYSVIELKDAIYELRAHKNFAGIPLLVRFDTTEEIEKQLISDMEYVWSFNFKDYGSVIAQVISDFVAEKEKIHLYQKLKSEFEQVKKPEEFTKVLEHIRRSYVHYEDPYLLILLESKTLYRMNELGESLKKAKQASKLRPKSLTPFLIMASIYQIAKKKEQVTEVVRKTKELEVVAFLVQCFQESTRKDIAVSDLVAKKGPGILFQNVTLGLTKSEVRKLYSADRWQQQEMAKFFNFQAIAYNNEGNTKEAERYFKAALYFLKDKDVEHKIWYNLALGRYKEKEYRKALEYCEQGKRSTGKEKEKFIKLIERIHSEFGKAG